MTNCRSFQSVNQVKPSDVKKDDEISRRNSLLEIPRSRSQISLKQTAECILYQTDCDEVFPNLYVGDA